MSPASSQETSAVRGECLPRRPQCAVYCGRIEATAQLPQQRRAGPCRLLPLRGLARAGESRRPEGISSGSSLQSSRCKHFVTSAAAFSKKLCIAIWNRPKNSDILLTFSARSRERGVGTSGGTARIFAHPQGADDSRRRHEWRAVDGRLSVPHLSAKALEEDPEGCALLMSVLRSASPPAATPDAAADGGRIDASPVVIHSDAAPPASKPPSGSRRRRAIPGMPPAAVLAATRRRA